MKEYIGTHLRVVKAIPAVSNDDRQKEGYRVFQKDIDGHGVETWNGKESFENTHVSLEEGCVPFGFILEYAKSKRGIQIARRTGLGTINYINVINEYELGDGTVQEAHFIAYHTSGLVTEWIPEVKDILATDWYVVKNEIKEMVGKL